MKDSGDLEKSKIQLYPVKIKPVYFWSILAYKFIDLKKVIIYRKV